MKIFQFDFIHVSELSMSKFVLFQFEHVDCLELKIVYFKFWKCDIIRICEFDFRFDFCEQQNNKSVYNIIDHDCNKNNFV